MEPLAFASIQVKDRTYGTTTKEDGTYELVLESGQYELVVSMVGYKTQIISIALDKDSPQNIIMSEDDSKTLDNVVIKVKIKDRAEEIIKNVIRNKDNITSASGPYSCQVYIKATMQDSTIEAKNKKYSTGTDIINNSHNDLGEMSMTEVFLHLDHASDQQIKEQRLGVKKNGRTDGLFYLTTTDGSINFYNNLIKVPALSPTPFLSPISYSGLIAYKFKTIKIERIGTHRNYIISVKPRQISNATVEGEITISDSSWAILHTHFEFPKYHLPEYDHFEVDQNYSFVQNKAWMLSRQEFTYYSKAGKKKVSGQTSVAYSDYELNKQFPRHYFGVEVSATAQEAYEKDTSFWKTVRTEPLTDKEVRFIQYKDSMFRVTHTKAYLDSMDAIINKITWKKMSFLGQTFYNRDKGTTIILPPLITTVTPFSFGGWRIGGWVWYDKLNNSSRKKFSLNAELSYGFRNKDLNGQVRISRMYNPFNRAFYKIEVRREFAHISEGDAWINMIKRSNFYLNDAFTLGHGFEVLNGLNLYTEGSIAFRHPVSDYKTSPKVDSLFGDVLTNNQAITFQPYNGVYTNVRLSYTPFQKYIREPREKVILGSKWPTFYANWNKGVPNVMGSQVDFDYLEYGIEQRINVGLLGIFHYNIKTGNFLDSRELKLVDYHYQRQGDPFLFMNPDEAFQALDSSFPVFKRFYQGHMVHEFNGALLNKIPLLKELQLREVAGGGFLIAPERNLKYAELFAGVERVFKWPFDPLSKFKIGVYVVGSAANKFSNPIQFKIGLTTWDKRRNRWN